MRRIAVTVFQYDCTTGAIDTVLTDTNPYESLLPAS